MLDKFSLEFKWEQVSPSLQDSFQYSVLCYGKDGLNLSSYFLIFKFLYQSFEDCSKCINYNWQHCHIHMPYFFSSLAISRYISFFSFSFDFILSPTGKAKSKFLWVFFFFADYHKVWTSGGDKLFRLYSKIFETFVRLLLLDRSWVAHIPPVRIIIIIIIIIINLINILIATLPITMFLTITFSIFH